MSFREPIQPLRDILESVRMIEDFTSGMTFEQFREDPKTDAAVERKFLVTGEAAVRLGREAPLIVADVPWRQIRDLEIYCATATIGSIWKSSGRRLRTICHP